MLGLLLRGIRGIPGSCSRAGLGSTSGQLPTDCAGRAAHFDSDHPHTGPRQVQVSDLHPLLHRQVTPR